MKHLLRPYKYLHLQFSLAAVTAFLVIAPPAAHPQAQDFAPFFEDTSPLLAHTGAPGYLGVDVVDVDADRAQTLKLKEVRGAVITLIDHDAPAGQIGLKVNDVVLAIDGQNVDGAEALRRILREIPPGRKVSLEISRDGNIQTLAVQLVDRKAMEKAIWSKIGIDADGISPLPPPGMGILPGGGSAPVSSGFHMSLFTGTLNVGALVEPLTSQMAEYLGVPGGLMVKQIAKKSEAAASGLKAFDVILKVGADSISTSADWDRALRSNVGKPVQVTILRDRKQQQLNLQVDSKHRSAVEYQKPFGPGGNTIVAERRQMLQLQEQSSGHFV
ncbi:MAG: PDZ domain-containing protein [Terracidiphilus sp.]